MMKRLGLTVLAVALTTSSAGCSSDDVPAASDGGPDDGLDDGLDGGLDSGPDSGIDGGERGDGGAERSCTREELEAVIDHYFDALEARDAADLPVTDDVRFTENGQVLELGEGLWQDASDVRFKRNAIDPERCGTHTQAVLSEDGVEVLYGARLRAEDGLLSEIETYIAREGNYVVLEGVSLFSTDGVADADASDGPIVTWPEVVPEDQRSTREELNEIADLYFESFGPRGIVSPIEEDCYRWENGVRTTSGDCSLFLPEPGTGVEGTITHRRYPIADVELGIAIGYVKFGDRLDFHMFKITDGQVRLIQAIVADDDGADGTGWEDQE